MTSNIDKTKKEYQNLMQQHNPNLSPGKNFLLAYLIGGTICVVGQGIINLLLSVGYSQSEASSLTAVILIFIGGLLTGLGVYDELAQIAGGGTIVPITGFANAIVSPALEYQQEGYVLGIGANIYSIAGPVLTYGIVTSFLVGVIQLMVK